MNYYQQINARFIQIDMENLILLLINFI